MAGLDPSLETAANYRRFAEAEAAGRSPVYERLAYAVAEDPVVLRFLSGLPELKRQPNLLFAAARLLSADATPSASGLRRLVVERGHELATAMLTRRTQTNEPARAAALLPALAQIAGDTGKPLTLIEVGASAGLVLQVDRYSYDYGGVTLVGADPLAPVLRCEARGATPVPAAVPAIAWAGGLDLNPLDPADPDDAAWLACLVWPDQPERAARLDAALATARRRPLPVTAGDLVADLPALVAQAPADTTVVVMHTAVLAYVDVSRRRDFAALIRDLGVRWVSNEGPGVLPDVDVPDYPEAGFALVVDGVAVAHTHPHGDWVHWH